MDAIDHAYAEVAAEEANQAPAPGIYIILLFVMIAANFTRLRHDCDLYVMSFRCTCCCVACCRGRRNGWRRGAIILFRWYRLSACIRMHPFASQPLQSLA